MGKIIVLEGIECSGKSTYLERLQKALCRRGFQVYGYSKDDSEIDPYLRIALQSETVFSDEMLLMMFVRYLEKERIASSLLNEYDFILLDRYDLSVKVFAGMLGLDGQVEELFRVFSHSPPIDCCLYFPLTFGEFCSRGGMERSSAERIAVGREWFLLKTSKFEKAFSDMTERKMEITLDRSFEEIVDYLCSDMC